MGLYFRKGSWFNWSVKQGWKEDFMWTLKLSCYSSFASVGMFLCYLVWYDRICMIDILCLTFPAAWNPQYKCHAPKDKEDLAAAASTTGESAYLLRVFYNCFFEILLWQNDILKLFISYNLWSICWGWMLRWFSFPGENWNSLNECLAK